MSKLSTRREFFRFAGGGTAVGIGVGLAGTAAVHSAGHAVLDDKPTAVDIGFCTDMTVHHVQALAMCQRVLGRDTGDPVQAAATEVLQTQAIEIGMMRAWLTDWGQSTAQPETAMGWMGMNGGEGMPTAMMPGLASDEQMRELASVDGREQGRLWLELMRTHHLGGVDMANAAVGMAHSEKVRRIAQVQVDVQTYEIWQYDLLLASEYRA